MCVCVCVCVCIYVHTHTHTHTEAFQVAQWWRTHLPRQELWETGVGSLGWEDPLEEEMATHSCILAWRIPRTEESGRLQTMESVQFSTVAQSYLTLAAPWTAAHQASLSVTNSWSLLKLLSTKSVMPSNHLILCQSLLLPPSIFPIIRVFSNESVLLIKWPKYWSFTFSVSLSNEYSGLIFFRIDWFCLLAVQETLKSLLQYHSSKASILWHSAFLMVQLSHSYMTTGKTITLTRWTFFSKVMSLLFIILSRLVLACLPRSKRLLISRLQPPSAVIWEPPKIKCVTVSTVSPSICHKVMGPEATILVFWMLSFKPNFSLSSFTFIKRLFSFFFFFCAFCHKGGVICMSVVIDISPGNLDSSLCFIQPSISHDVLCI